MTRPCFLVIDPEHAGSISTRKLVIESAKFNVVTAYSADEAVDTLRRFPNLDGAVLDARIPDMPVIQLAHSLKDICPTLPLILVDSPYQERPAPIDLSVESLNPRALLEVLQSICPEATREIERHDHQLAAEEDQGDN